MAPISARSLLDSLRHIAGGRLRPGVERPAAGTRPSGRVDLLLVCSAGGHLLQLHLLRAAWEPYTRLWVTHDKEDTRSLLADEQMVYVYGPTTRNIPNLFRNLGLAVRVVGRARPRVVVTTGAGLAVPFAWVSRAFGAKVIYVESITRVDGPSLSCRLIAPIADRVYVQWPELSATLRGARYAGSVLPVG